ncbi:MAG TPA: efflux RND transporter permease subunit [Actinomycetota bacterium]|nr:efflux RND transporter permease subunit [Actinomycetota bacterium]
MRWIVGSSLKFRYVVAAAAAGLMFFGVQQMRGMPVDVFPEFAPPRVEIQTLALGLSATEVESLITVPMEQTLNGVPGLDEIRSKSVEQLSQIELIFERGQDLLTARQLVAERVAAIGPTLPRWAAPPVMIQPLSATSRVMKIGMTSDEYSLLDLSMTAYWKVRARLLRVPGVANVLIWGERIKMPTVQVDPERLREHDLTLEQVMTVTADAIDSGLLRFSDGGFIGTGGFLDTNGTRLQMQHDIPIFTDHDLARLPIVERDGEVLRLEDVADVTIDTPPLMGDGVVNDREGLLLVVQKLPWANTADVTAGLDEAIGELEQALPGIEMDPTIFRPATFIENAIDNLGGAMILGAILMILMLGAFLFEWRTALISVTAIPLSLIAAGLVLKWQGVTINTMVLAGLVIALGDIVDDAIIDIENVVRRLREHRKAGGTKPTARVILDASLEVRSAIVYATLIEVVAVIPIFTLEGLSGAFFRPLALSYALALLASMVVALTVTPALSLIFFRSGKSLQHRTSPLVPPLQRGYVFLLSKIVLKPRRAYVAVGLTALIGIGLVPMLGQDLLPSFKERDFLMHWLAKPGTSRPEEVRTTMRVNAELLTIPGVRNAGSHIGQAMNSDEPYGIYFGENWVSVDPSVDYDQTLAKIQETVQGYPGIYRDVQTYLKERIREVLTGSSDAIVVRIFGHDLGLLQEKALEVQAILDDIDGVVDPFVDTVEDIPQIQIEVDLEAAQRYGLKPGDVRRSAATLIMGEEVGDLFRDGQTYDVNVWSTPETRQNLTDIEELLIDTPTGEYVHLEDVADIQVIPTPNDIHHEGLFRSIDVSANVRGRDLGSAVSELDDRLEQVEWPPEFHAELLGEFAERQAAQNRLFIFAIGAAIGIFLLLQASFGSWRLASIAFFTLPIALIGGVIAAYLGGRILSLGSLVGFLTVLGIVARNGIMLISHYQHLERFEGEPFGPGLIIRGARERVVPIMMTVFTTGLALIPLVWVGQVPGNEVEHPMAVVIMGGLITATLLNLFVVPVLYLAFGKSLKGAAELPEAAG